MARRSIVAVLFITLSPLWVAGCQLTPIRDPTSGDLATSTRPVSSPVLQATTLVDEKTYPQATAALWAAGYLWTANETGLLTRWEVRGQTYQQYRLPGKPVIHTLASDGQTIYLGTAGSGLWSLTADGSPPRLVKSESGRISALTLASDKYLWYANAGNFNRSNSRYQAGRGLVFMEVGGEVKIHHFSGDEGDHPPLTDVTALIFDPNLALLWVGTRAAGVLGYDVNRESWQAFNTFNSDLADNTVNDLKQAPDGSLWLATAGGISVYRDGVWENHRLAEDAPDRAAWSLAIAGDNTVWVAGQSYIARLNPGQTWQIYHLIDNPLLADRFRFVVLDDEDRPWFIGRQGKVHFDGQTWTAYDADVRHLAHFTPVQPAASITPPPLDFPSPTRDYVTWLKTWPRPDPDNGRGMHFLQTHQFDPIEAQRQVNRLKRLGVRWALVLYADHEQLVRIAPIFQAAGITAVWRPFIRPDETYDGWTKDVEFLRSRGLAPYFQLYNEPGLAQESGNGQPVAPEVYWRHLLPAVRQVYDAGGYVGLQLIDPDRLRQTLQTLKAQGLGDTFDRLFFVPHLYGLNHPPEYDQDINGVLGFRRFAQVFEAEIGFVPVMIAGEGGWRPGEAQDNRYPAISAELHRAYHLAVFDWFRTGTLSNGEALPDYFFAFCPWLISDPEDPAAWFDSATGDRTLTIEAVTAMPAFERKFSWD